jgi:aspartyl-tRNA synthetase
MVFLHLRQRTDSVQSVLSVEEGKVSKFMVKWAAGLTDESIVLVEGIVQRSPEEIKSATIKDVELKLTRVRTLCYFTFGTFSVKIDWTDPPDIWP